MEKTKEELYKMIDAMSYENIKLLYIAALEFQRHQ